VTLGITDNSYVGAEFRWRISSYPALSEATCGSGKESRMSLRSSGLRLLYLRERLRDGFGAPPSLRYLASLAYSIRACTTMFGCRIVLPQLRMCQLGKFLNTGIRKYNVADIGRAHLNEVRDKYRDRKRLKTDCDFR
jgi:hypothetical protein